MNDHSASDSRFLPPEAEDRSNPGIQEKEEWFYEYQQIHTEIRAGSAGF
jgi:hypothetical protein